MLQLLKPVPWASKLVGQTILVRRDHCDLHPLPPLPFPMLTCPSTGSNKAANDTAARTTAAAVTELKAQAGEKGAAAVEEGQAELAGEQSWREGTIVGCFHLPVYPCATTAPLLAEGERRGVPGGWDAGAQYLIEYLDSDAGRRNKWRQRELISWLWLRRAQPGLSHAEADALIGRRVWKRFGALGLFIGVVNRVLPPARHTVGHDTDDGNEFWFGIQYQDGDREDVSFQELLCILIPSTGAFPYNP